MYHVVIETEAPDPESVEGARSAMGLLNAAMARIIKDADDFVITLAQYDKGRLELDVLTKRLLGIVDASVRVRVKAAEQSSLSRSS